MRRLAFLALALSLATAAEARLDLEARRLAFDRPDGTYAASDVASLALTYRPSGDAGTLSDVRVEVEIRTSPVTRLPYRVRQIAVPQGDREFVMPVDFSKLGIAPGTYAVVATIDGNDSFPEEDENNNQARTTLTIASRASSGQSQTTQPPASSTSAAAQSLRPRSSRVVAQTTCSAFEREWASPLEVGWHPGYGAATLALEFDHPLTVPRMGERVVRAVLRLKGDVQGRPFADLGALQVVVRTKASRGARCGMAAETKLSLADFDGDESLDLTRSVRDAEDLSPECAAAMQVTLSFPATQLEPQGAAMIRLAAQGATLEVETGR